MDDYTIETERALRYAGWTPGRKVDTGVWRRRLEKSGFIVSEAAECFLSEFGGLMFHINGPRISCARERFELDPLLNEGDDAVFTKWSKALGESLTPIEILEPWFPLGISKSGEIYLVAEWLASFGSARQALENLILGVMPREVA